MEASGKISRNDLNFSIEYDSKDELGKLCNSFEIMRTTLAENFSDMWRQVEERRQLNAAFAHDLRTPLTVLKGYDEMLKASDDPKTRDTAATMEKHILRMETMELKTIGLTKKFGAQIAVNHLNVVLSNGVYDLLGTNGAGKTTFMRLLCNIQPPTSGEIILNGKNIAGLGEKYRDFLGYLPQHFGYYPDFTALDFLLYVSALKGLDDKSAKKKSKELLESVGLSAESKRKIKTFSGGMKQRLGIAQAMRRQCSMTRTF